MSEETIVAVDEPTATIETDREIPVHPLADRFPLLDGEELEDLVEDIRSTVCSVRLCWTQTGHWSTVAIGWPNGETCSVNQRA